MRHLRSLLLASVLALPLAAPAALAATPDGVLVVAQNIDDIVAIDPAQAYEFTSGELVTNIYDRLVQYDAEDPTVLAPGLATEWTEDPAAKTITFTLRDGAKFHSGNPVRAEDVVFSFARVVKLNLTPAFILTQLGWTPENIAEMVTADGNKVTVKYEGDFSPAFVMNVLASRPASVVDEPTVMANEANGDMGNAWMNAHSAGSGPFSLQDYRPAELVRLTAFPDYFKGAPKVDSVIIRHVAESATQQLLLQQGDVDMAKNLTPDQIAGLPADTIKVEVFPQAAVHFLSFNQKVEALQPEAVWEAARYLVDYQGMTDTILKGQMETHQAFWPKGFPGSLDETPFTYDPEKAKQILADAGVDDADHRHPRRDQLRALHRHGAVAAGELRRGRHQLRDPARHRQPGDHQVPRPQPPGDAALLGPGLHGPALQRQGLRLQRRQLRRRLRRDDDLAQRLGGARGDERADARRPLRARPRQAARMYVDLQKQVQAKSPIVIMFQAAYQVAMDKGVTGYVNGATSDFVYYRLVEKN